MTTDNTPATLATAKHGGCVQLKDWQHVLVLREMRAQFTDAGSPARTAALDAAIAALSAKPSPGGQSAPEIEQLRALVSSILSTVSLGHQKGPYAYAGEDFGRYLAEAARDCRTILRALSDLAARQPVGESQTHWGWLADGVPFKGNSTYDKEAVPLYAGQPGPTAQAVDLEQTFQAGVAEWMGQCFVPSLYSNMTERGDRLLEEVLELLQAHGYDKARIPTLVDYVFGRPVGDPAQEVGGVMVTLAGYCWVAGLDMHAAGYAELARISQADVMAKIRAKQEAKNALHFDTPLPGNAVPAQAVDLGPVPLIARALAEWHEDDGNVLWWAWCGRDWAGEPAWAGTPNDSDWPGYHTHWTPHPTQPALLDSQAVGNG